MLPNGNFSGLKKAWLSLKTCRDGHRRSASRLTLCDPGDASSLRKPDAVLVEAIMVQPHHSSMAFARDEQALGVLHTRVLNSSAHRQLLARLADANVLARWLLAKTARFIPLVRRIGANTPIPTEATR